MAANLVFSRARHTGGPAHLVFGGDGGEPPTPDPLVATFAIALSGPTWAGTAVYDNRNPRRVSAAARSAHQVAGREARGMASIWGLSDREMGDRSSAWQVAALAADERAAPWVTSARLLPQFVAPLQQGTPAQTERDLVHQVADSLHTRAQAPWGTGSPASNATALVHQAAASLVRQGSAPWQLAQGRQAVIVGRHERASSLVVSRLMPWQVASRVPPGREVWPPDGPGTVTPRVPSAHLVFACPPAWSGSGPVHLVFGRVCNIEQPPALIVVPARSVYMVINSASLRRVSNSQSLPTYGTSLTIDSDSWTWGFSASMPADALSLIQRTDPAEPVEVELTINGNTYRALIESAVRSRTFKDWTLNVRGRGLGAVLDSPYAPQQVFRNTSAMTAQQLMGDALTVNGSPIGWTLDWNIDDWLVPTDAWSHQGSMMSAVNAIAAAAGAYIQPHPTGQILRVLPKYPSAPWDWAGTVTPDLQLPADVMSVEGIEWVDRAAYNRVFVSGVQHGNVAQVTRTGTAGDLLAPMVTDALVTATEASRQRGLYELAKGGRWAELSLKLPVLAETGVIHPGKFVRYNDGAVDRLGIVRSANVQDDGTEIWQTIGVESYVA